jgi:large repetitive protein
MRVSTIREAVRPTPGRRARRALGSVAVAATLMIGLAPEVSAAPTPTITIRDVTLTEGNAGTTNAVFTIQVAPAPKQCCALQVGWTTAPGAAGAGADYTASSGTVSLSRTTPSRTVSVPVVGDTLDEANEAFVVNLSNLVGSPGTIGDAQATATITDDDPLPVLSIDDVTVPEGNAGATAATFTISLSTASGRAVTVDWVTTAGTATAGTDHVAAGGSRTIAAGSTAGQVAVTVNGDATAEADETFEIALSNASNATIGDGSGLGTIANDDGAPVASVDDVTVAEGDGGTSTATFTISLSATSGQDVGVQWATTASTATAGADYVAGSGSRTIAAGSTTTTVDVTVNGDALDENDESFGIALSNPTGATIGDGSGAGTITDDDPAPSVAITDASVTEGDVGTKTMTFTVALSAASARTVTVDWATGDDVAVAPGDYASASGTLTFTAGQTSTTMDVTTNGDGIAELDEPFVVALSSPTNATIGDGQGAGTIVDDELQPVIDIDAPSASEGNAGTRALTFTVSLSHPSALPVTLDWTTSPGTAVAGTDYLSGSGTVTFASLDTSEPITVTVNGDALYERDETVVIELSNATNAPIGRPRRAGTIANDDAPPVLSIADDSVTEGDAGTGTLRFTVTLSTISGADATVDYATTDGTASAGSDYAAASGTVTIPSGSSTGTVNVTVQGDSSYEPDEDLTLSLSAPDDATVGDGTARGSIENDDRIATTITLTVLRGRRSITAKGILEPTTSGHKVSVTLLRKRGGRFVKVAAKTVSVKGIKDRDGDGRSDGSYAAAFSRPSAGGAYKVVAKFKGTQDHAPSSRSDVFRLPAG